MTVHLISVGLSLRGNLLRGDLGLFGAVEEPALTHTLVPTEGEVAVERRLLADRLTDGTRQARDLDATIAAVRPERWRSRASAELTTAARSGAPGAGELPPVARAGSDEVVVLATSDTVGGLHAALWNALALTGGDRARVRYLERPSLAAERGHGTVLIAPIPGLDTAGPEGFTTAMAHLGRLGRALIDVIAGRGEEYAFHLSGGYKATIPYLVGLAEGMLGLRERGEVGSVRAGIQHESAPERLVPLPLRALPYEVVREELRETVMDPVTGGRVLARQPERLLLDGYAYQRDGRTWRLTPFGEGLLALIS